MSRDMKTISKLLLVLSATALSCGSVAVRDDGDAGAPRDTRVDVAGTSTGGSGGTGGAVGAGGSGGTTGTGGASGAGGASGTGGTAAGVVLRGGLDAVGPTGAAAAPGVLLVRSGLTFPSTGICNQSICVNGGIIP
jgi:hypothetical protein